MTNELGSNTTRSKVQISNSEGKKPLKFVRILVKFVKNSKEYNTRRKKYILMKVQEILKSYRLVINGRTNEKIYLSSSCNDGGISREFLEQMIGEKKFQEVLRKDETATCEVNRRMLIIVIKNDQEKDSAL